MSDKNQIPADQASGTFTPVVLIPNEDRTGSPLSVIEAFTTVNLIPGSIKAGMKSAGAGSRDLWQVPLANIHFIEGLNPRVMTERYKAHIRDIADSMHANGVYQDQPLAGYVARRESDESGELHVFIYSGHSRVLGAKLAVSEGAPIETMPITVSQASLSQEDINVALISGNKHKELTYYESALVCHRLVIFGFEIEEIARRTCITIPLIKARLSLMASPLKLRELVANEVVSATLAIELITAHGGNKALEKIEEAQAAATESGKARVTKARTENVGLFERAKFVKKVASKLYDAAGAVQEDPGYASLSSETRELLEALLNEIKAKGGPNPEKAVDPRQLTIEALK